MLSLPELLLANDFGSQLGDDCQRAFAAEQYITCPTRIALTTIACLNATEAIEQQNKFADAPIHRDDFAMNRDVDLFV